MQAGLDALARQPWPEAFELLSQADRERQLSGVDLEALVLAAFFAAHADVELEVKERAFKVYQAEAGAEVALREAHALGRSPQPALALVRLAEGTDIVGSTNLAEALGDQAWEQVLRWHDDMLRKLVASGGGEIVNSTGDGFFVAFESARPGVECAISIQRALLEHRASAGFALPVRIGLHTAEANRRGTDYSGKGVHVAARVAALAAGGEILATAETLAEAGDVPASDARTTPIRGVSAPVCLAAISWN
jgi:class 3 adenylate cyclase